MSLAVFARLWQFGAVPAGLNQDEAFAAYEAWSLLNSGIDSHGYHFPVYLVAWGSGMNALETYLMMPFIALFGLKVWVIRLPQLIVGLLSVWVMYLTVRKIGDEVSALTAMLIIAVCPWHVLLSRWGLESNLLPGFLLFGYYFYLCGRRSLSALMFGLSLYAYATAWMLVPFVTVILAVKGKTGIRPFVILFVCALPLLLFVAVNLGWMEEVNSFISIPRLLYFRSGEVKGWNADVFKILLLGDGRTYNSTDRFNFLFYITVPLALVGVLRKNWRLLAVTAVSILVCMRLSSPNVNRVNMIFIPVIILAGLGTGYLSEKFGKSVFYVTGGILLVLFACFEIYCFSSFRPFPAGLDEALERADAIGGTVYLDEDIYYPQVLFYEQIPAEEFISTVEYANYPAAYLKTDSFSEYKWGEGPLTIASKWHVEDIKDNYSSCEQFGDYYLLY